MVQRDMIRVTVPFIIIVSGLRAELIYENVGGHPAVKVICDQYRDRFFRIDYYKKIIAGDEYLEFLARDICLYLHTGIHPTDIVKPENKSFVGKSLERTICIVRQVVENNIAISQELLST